MVHSDDEHTGDATQEQKEVPTPVLDDAGFNFDSEEEVEWKPEDWQEWVLPFGRYKDWGLMDVIKIPSGRGWLNWFMDQPEDPKHVVTKKMIRNALAYYVDMKRSSGHDATTSYKKYIKSSTRRSAPASGPPSRRVTIERSYSTRRFVPYRRGSDRY